MKNLESQLKITRPMDLPEYIDYDERSKMPYKQRLAIRKEIEDRHGLTEEEAEILVRYLEDFNLKLDDMTGRKIIDIGSGPGDFKKALGKLGDRFDVVSFDNGLVWETAMDVRGDATRMPFKDGSFDMALAHGSVPLMFSTRGEHDRIAPTLEEIVRITSENGTAKIFPVAISNPGFPEIQEEYDQMAAIVTEELKKIHGTNPDLRIKITQINDPDGPITRRLLEVFK